MAAEREIDPEKLGLMEDEKNKKFVIVKGGKYFGEIGTVVSRDEEKGNVAINSELNGEITVPFVDVNFAEDEKEAIEKSQKLMAKDRERIDNAGL